MTFPGEGAPLNAAEAAAFDNLRQQFERPRKIAELLGRLVENDTEELPVSCVPAGWRDPKYIKRFEGYHVELPSHQPHVTPYMSPHLIDRRGQ
ncbi:MAG TPA: hypothetical protein VHD60_04290 [Candidatus Saccharimonadales bacterium]|nr:hypothetical protein [Candidatus Saccharimonadales bacterium]